MTGVIHFPTEHKVTFGAPAKQPILQLPRLVAERHAQFAESAKREQAIQSNLRGLGYDR
mgnify:CR=1 FL=1